MLLFSWTKVCHWSLDWLMKTYISLKHSNQSFTGHHGLTLWEFWMFINITVIAQDCRLLNLQQYHCDKLRSQKIIEMLLNCDSVLLVLCNALCQSALDSKNCSGVARGAAVG